MFGNKETKERTPTTSLSHSCNTLIEGTTLVGTINAANDIRIDGKLEGTVICSGKMIIGPHGEVQGDAECQNAVIEGRFSGKLKVFEKLNVRESANVTAEVDTNQLEVHSGATFNGNCNMGSQKLKPIKGVGANGSIETESALANA